MISKVLFPALIVLLVAQTLAQRSLCPNIEVANLLAYNQTVREAAPESGRIEKEYIIPPLEQEVTCILLSGTATGSVTSLGLTENGIKVKLVSDIQQGFDLVLEVYTK